MKLTTENTEDTKRATPETDDQPIIYALNELQYQILCVDLEFARKLERERDEARAELAAVTEQLDEYKRAFQSAENHNHKMFAALEIVTEQRDEAREELNRYKRQWQESRSENVEGVK